jgi:uncharacterized membrane protein
LNILWKCFDVFIYSLEVLLFSHSLSDYMVPDFLGSWFILLIFCSSVVVTVVLLFFFLLCRYSMSVQSTNTMDKRIPLEESAGVIITIFQLQL